jgi:hypothetical protein
VSKFEGQGTDDKELFFSSELETGARLRTGARSAAATASFGAALPPTSFHVVLMRRFFTSLR